MSVERPAQPGVLCLTLQLGATEVPDHVLPVGRVVVSSKVWLEFAAEDLERRALANTVRSHQAQHVSGSRHRQAVQFEAVGRIAMRDLTLEVRGKVDNGDSTEGATLGADTTTDAKRFRDEGDTGLGRHL